MRLSNLPRRLLLIVSAAILPLAIVCGFALQALIEGQAEQTRASAVGVARALATAVDSELRRTIATLQVLALAEPFSDSDEASLTQARRLAEAVRASHPEWRGLLMAAPSGAVVFNTENPSGPVAENVVERPSLDAVLRTGAPAVGPMARGARGNLAFPVRVPVLRDGMVRYVLTAIVRPEAIADVLQRQSTPTGWSASVFDSKLARVARSIDDDKFRGTAPSESLQALLRDMGDRKEEVGLTTTIEGVRVQAAVARMDAAPWTVALGASIGAADLARRDTLWAYGGGVVLSLCLGLLAAWWLSRAITGPMARLRRDASAMTHDASIAPLQSGIPEIDAVGVALTGAAVQRARNENERDRLLGAERTARALAMTAGHRLERLVDASALLSRSLEEASTLMAIAQVVVPDIADLCRIDLLDDHGVLVRKLTHHVDPERSAQIAQMVSTLTAASDSPGSFPWAIATGRTFLHNLTDPDMPEITDPGMRDFIVRLDISAACVVPLVARGRTLGAMAVLQAGSGRHFTTDDGVLIGELAQRAALALDNVRLLADARAAQQQAESANRAKDEFLAMLGHELRNPLAPITLALQLIARRDEQAFPKERQIIERQVKYLSRMVDDLLDVSRIVSGKVELAFESVDLRSVVTQALEQVMPAMRQRASLPHADLPEAPVFVRGDPLRLGQIVGNLLNNAAKFTPPERDIRVAVTVEDGQAWLDVSDQGIGIARELLPHVFERFVQGQQQLQRASGGLGLGLAIAQSLARLHGGVMEAASEGAGRGSTFTLRLPLLASVDLPMRAEQEQAEAPQRLRLLLVDDNLDALKMLAEWCTLEGHEVAMAGTAEDALPLLEANTFDAGIFDIGLPGISGYELARRVRVDPRNRSMTIVALTGYGQDSDRQLAIDAGFDDHFPKPADIERVLRHLEELVVRRRTATA